MKGWKKIFKKSTEIEEEASRSRVRDFEGTHLVEFIQGVLYQELMTRFPVVLHISDLKRNKTQPSFGVYNLYSLKYFRVFSTRKSLEIFPYNTVKNKICVKKNSSYYSICIF
jgi:hypothetical protein